MRAAFLVATRQIEIGEMEDTDPGAGECLVRVAAVGICGTDLHIFEGESNYSQDDKGDPVPLDVQPQVLGHEICGTVEVAGEEVTGLEPGDRVVIDQGLNCSSQGFDPICEYCRTGHTHQCEHYREYGITGLPGGMRERMVVPAVNLLRVATEVPPEQAVMTEPVGCVLHACDMMERAQSRYRLSENEGDHAVRTVLVCGGGPAGQVFLQVIRRVLGFAGLIVLTDPSPEKRRLAEQFGATTINPDEGDLVSRLHDLTGGRMVEVCVDACGSGELFTVIPRLIRKQATVLLYGIGHAGAPLSALDEMQWKEPTIILPVGASGSLDDDGRPLLYRRALGYIENGTIDVASMTTHACTGLDSIPGALGNDRGAGYIKGVVTLSGW